MKEAVNHLAAYLSEYHQASTANAFMFYTIHQGKQTQMTAANVDNMLKKYATLAKEYDPLFPSHLHAHMFRHSTAMAMYKKGVPLSYIRDFLGLENIDTVRIYAYADSETIEEALKSSKYRHQPEYFFFRSVTVFFASLCSLYQMIKQTSDQINFLKNI